MRYLISDPSDIDLKTSEKKLLYFAILSLVSIFVATFLVLFFISSLHFSPIAYAFVVFIIIILFIIFIYKVMYYILNPIFKANYLLELLLKDTLHELNIPLSVIKANLQILRLDQKDSKVLKRFDRIEKASMDLDRLYRDVEYYIKREVRFELKEEFDLKELAQAQIEKIKDQELHVKISADLKSLMLKADRHGFAKALGNLLQNAVKYNKDDNEIRVILADNRLCVIDEGIGMSETEVFKIFDRYYQSDKSKEGFGIGLDIVKAYCDEEGIFINITSKKGKGTTICLDLSNILL